MLDNPDKVRKNADKLYNYLFDQIGKYLQDYEVTNEEMLCTVMMMALSLIGSLKVIKAVKLELLYQHFKAIRHAIEATEDITEQ